jgi:CheY-specific phosphatase CheX
MTAHASISSDDLVAVQAELSSTVLPGQAKQLSSMPVDAHNHASLAAEVRLWGAWHGKVAVCMSVTLARAAAAQMRGCPANDISDEMALDAVGEIANVTAGSVKSLLQPPTDMALPTSIATYWEDIEYNDVSEAAVVYFSVDTSYFSIAVTPGATRSRVRRNRLG